MKVTFCVLLLVALVHCTAAAYSNINLPAPYGPYVPYPCRPCPDTCRNTICPRYRSAVCRVMPCTCQRRWFLRTNYFGYYSGYQTDVTVQCSTRPYVPVPYSNAGPVINPAPVVKLVVHFLPEHGMKPTPSPIATESPRGESSPVPTPAHSPQPVDIDSAHGHIHMPSPHHSPYPCERCSDTCRYTLCPRFPGAVCQVTRCTCQPRWHFGGRDVTAQCLTHPGLYYIPGPVINPAPVVHYFPVPEVEPRVPMSPEATESTSEGLMMTMESPAPTPASSPQPVEVESS